MVKPECDSEADAIIIIGWGFAMITILVILILLMLFLYYKKRKKTITEFLPILFVYLFSIILGIGSIGTQIPISPYFQIFFVLFQSTYFFLSALEIYNN